MTVGKEMYFVRLLSQPHSYLSYQGVRRHRCAAGGQYLLSQATGVLRVGDKVEIIEQQTPSVIQ
ncbi:hypothetical protein KDH_74460 [Dictyobacter sp. S3.2.2.5]|uniref:MOSC domain-containing protein n=1 Tax=Dictyobacter halimunensis TaxID=3026934 RepID=A0ABQ6G5Q5_9CHLR|nr:hypothetical protein KDH_74460 [Dictyobacter sp. S3.2.2.5]